MRKNSTMVDADVLVKLERKHLETHWQQAWESCAEAAQMGDYAEAERCYEKARRLGNQLTAIDHTLNEMGQPLTQGY
jgi:hypothetical protein